MQRASTVVTILPAIQLTASGRPQLDHNETEHASLAKADLQFEELGGTATCTSRRHEDGAAVLTNQRIIWIDLASAPSPGASCFLPLHCIESLEASATHRWSTKKLRIRMHSDGHGSPIPRQSNYSQIRELKIVSRHYGSFADKAQSLMFQASGDHKGGSQSNLEQPQSWMNPLSPTQERQPYQSHIQKEALSGWLNPVTGPQVQNQVGQQSQYIDQNLLQQLAGMGFSHNRASRACASTQNTGVEAALQWLFEREGDPSLDAPLQSAQSPNRRGTDPNVTRTSELQTRSTIGIAGILKREEQIAAKNDRTLEEAFQDLRGLMTKAQEMVQLAEKFRETLQAKGDNKQSETMDPEMQQQLIEIGIASPVTKEMAGAEYHKQLSRQLADFLVPRLGKAGGIMTLADVYCLFNRARGTELISPDDLLQAASLFTKWNASMHLRQFSSGVSVIESNLHSDDEICTRIANLVSGEGCGPPLSTTRLASEFNIPITIASQHLSTAEVKGILCRDDGPEGLRFFRNFFEEVAC